MNVAVLMSTYNASKYLDIQLESLANQTIADQITIYIRDDGSKDCTFEIIEKWKSKVSIVLIKGNNKGPAKSFWMLLTNMNINADYYAFCDQDDVWDSDKLECQISRLGDEFHLCLCNCRVIDSDGNVTNEVRRARNLKIALPRLFVAGAAQGCAMVFTKEIRNFIVSKDIQCIPMHDIIVSLYALQLGKIYWEYTPKFSYRFHENNVVAKTCKSKTQKLKTTIKNWKNSSKNSMSTVAEELLNNCIETDCKLTYTDREFLNRMSEYRDSFTNKIWLLKNKAIQDMPKSSLRSFKIRVMLGVL